MSVLGKLLGIDWLARKLGYVEQDVRTLRRDLTDLSGRVQELEQRATVRALGVTRRLEALERIGSAELNALRAHVDERLERLEAEVRAIPRPNVVEVPVQLQSHCIVCGGLGHGGLPCPATQLPCPATQLPCPATQVTCNARLTPASAPATPPAVPAPVPDAAGRTEAPGGLPDGATGSGIRLSDHFEPDPTCPIGQLHELGPARWAVHPVTLADIEAKRLESVQVHTYGTRTHAAQGGRHVYSEALDKLRADMDASEAELLKLAPEERSRRWAETLAAWAPKVEGETFFGVERVELQPIPVKPWCCAPALVTCSCKGECRWLDLCSPACGPTCSSCEGRYVELRVCQIASGKTWRHIA